MTQPDDSRPRAVLIPGSPAAQSSSRRVAELLLARPALARFESIAVELSELPAEALLARGEAAEVDAALAAVGRADLVVIATPIFRATYTGLLKTFFDLMPQDFLADKVCVAVATGAGSGHRLAIDHAMRPLVASLGGLCAATGVYATSDDLVEGEPSEALAELLDQAAEEASRLTSAG